MIIQGELPLNPDIEIIKVYSIKSMYEEFARLINRLNPTVLISYNGFGFDFPYLETQYKVFGDNGTLPEMGRLKGVRLDKDKDFSWESGAYGNVTINFPEIPGILNVDMYLIVKREKKLRNYKLGFVSETFLNKSKHDVKPTEMNQIIQANIQMMKRLGIADIPIEPFRPIKIKDPTAAAPTKSGRKDDGEDELEGDESKEDEDDGEDEGDEVEPDKNNIRRSEDEEITKTRDPRRILDLSTDEKIIAETKRFCDYCIQDAVLTILLFEKFNQWTSLPEAASAFRVNIIDTYTRGQQLKVASHVHHACHAMGFVMSKRNAPVYDFTGGLVQDPVTGLTDNTICYDFNSMYPSIIQEFNICFSSLIPGIFTEQSDENPDYHEIVCPMKNGGQRVFRYSKKEKGLLPYICAELVRKRKETRNILKTEKDPFKKDLLDARQNALKVAANSVFGVLGTQKGKYTLIEGAMSITCKGQQLISKVADYLKDKYGARIIYGDTDSVMVDFGITDRKKVWEMGEKTEEEINHLFLNERGESKLKVEFEKAMVLLCITKKKYAAIKINKDGSLDVSPKGRLIKGVVAARRDVCKWQVDIFQKLLDKALFGGTMEDAVTLIDETLRDLYSGRISWKDLLISKGMSASYKSENALMKVFAAECAKKGQTINAGDRVEYLFVVPRDCPNEKIAGKRMRMMEIYAEDLDSETAEHIDYNRYANNVVKNTIEKLFGIAYRKELEKRYEDVYSYFDYRKACYEVIKEDEMSKFKYKMGKGKAKREACIEILSSFPTLRTWLDECSRLKVDFTKDIIQEVIDKQIVPIKLNNLLNEGKRPIDIYTTLTHDPSIGVTDKQISSIKHKYIDRKSKDIRFSRIDAELVKVASIIHRNWSRVGMELMDKIKKQD